MPSPSSLSNRQTLTATQRGERSRERIGQILSLNKKMTVVKTVTSSYMLSLRVSCKHTCTDLQAAIASRCGLVQQSVSFSLSWKQENRDPNSNYLATNWLSSPFKYEEYNQSQRLNALQEHSILYCKQYTIHSSFLYPEEIKLNVPGTGKRPTVTGREKGTMYLEVKKARCT